MNNTKHTPGPWEARIGKGDLKLGQYPSKAMHFTIESGTRKLMAMGEAWKCEDDPTMFSEVTANAHLIAAAPAMYAWIAKVCKDGLSFENIKEGRALLSQAEGR